MYTHIYTHIYRLYFTYTNVPTWGYISIHSQIMSFPATMETINKPSFRKRSMAGLSRQLTSVSLFSFETVV